MATRQKPPARKSPPVTPSAFGVLTDSKTPGASEKTDIPKSTFVGEQLPYPDRNARVAEAAYFRAQQRGFAPGYELEDWLGAEQEVDALFSSVRPPTKQ